MEAKSHIHICNSSSQKAIHIIMSQEAVNSASDPQLAGPREEVAWNVFVSRLLSSSLLFTSLDPQESLQFDRGK